MIGRSSPRLLSTVVLIVFCAVIVNGCGGSDSSPSASASLEHIHGLGINPKDQALVVATHAGLFRIPAGSNELARIGESDDDFMGFNVVGPDRFLGSGHPGALSNGVDPLGFIRSADGGQTWVNVSLEGEADFHSLRASGQSIYGVEQGRLMASADGGQSWEERDVPVEFFDIAISPSDPDHVVAASEKGLFTSSDGGRRWRRVSEMIGLLAWSPDDRLYLVDGAGATHVSKDGGKSWSHAGEIGGSPVALFAAGNDELYGALNTGAIMESADGGATWTSRAQP